MRYPINAMKGIRVGVDLSKLALPLLSRHERMGFEITVDKHVKGNFFATAEAGWLQTDLSRETYHYMSSGFYGKIGIDYNLLKSRRPGSNDILYGGLRYGMSVFSHKGEDITVPGYYWENATAQDIPQTVMSSGWIEFLLGIKAEVIKNFYIGMTFRGKFRIAKPKDNYSTPYFIPGYGSGSAGFALGLNYYLSYNIRF
jgi:hypothetical protein